MLSSFSLAAATAQIYALSLHDALPISTRRQRRHLPGSASGGCSGRRAGGRDRKSTRLNSSHANISYAVFCLKKKNYNIIAQVFPITRQTYISTNTMTSSVQLHTPGERN